MTPSCLHCHQPFEITKDDLAFLKKLSPTFGGRTFDLPPPTHCPECRQQRRVAQGNQLYLYRRKCDFTGAPMISNYHPSSPYKVYKQDVWWSDKWDALSYGQPIDWKRPFFEQYFELLLKVPRFALHTSYEYDENAEYTNYCTKNKDCYLIFDSDMNRNCYYSYSANSSQDCMDCFRIDKCERCYECVDSVQCYGCFGAQDCQNCAESLFLKNCIGCKNCIMCSNLKNKQYWVENAQVSKGEFERIKNLLMSREAISGARERFAELCLQYPQRFMHGVQNEDVLGDYLTNCKNAQHCFDSRDLWDCRYNYQGWMKTKDAMDVQEIGDTEIAYECTFSGMEAQRLWFTSHCFGSHDILYCSYCPHSSSLFGCVGVKRKQYCILNVQYTKNEYEELAGKLIDHMRNDKTGGAMNRSATSSPAEGSRATGSWGEYFPMRIAPFAYNETLAQDYFPLTKKECEKEGLVWRDDDPHDRLPATFAAPETIETVPDTVTGEILTCGSCSKNYRIIQKELEFLRTMNLPLPRECFFCRHRSRMLRRNPRKLWSRKCSQCAAEIETTYAPNRKERVYCEKCYQSEIL